MAPVKEEEKKRKEIHVVQMDVMSPRGSCGSNYSNKSCKTNVIQIGLMSLTGQWSEKASGEPCVWIFFVPFLSFRYDIYIAHRAIHPFSTISNTGALPRGNFESIHVPVGGIWRTQVQDERVAVVVVVVVKYFKLFQYAAVVSYQWRSK